MHRGTVPSKALRHIAQQIYDCKYSPLFTLKKNLNFQDILYSGTNIIQQQAEIRQEYYERNDVELIKGTASFLTPQKIQVHSPDKETETIIADYFVIAVGSRPYRPSNIDFSSPKIFDSDTILTMKDIPKSAIVYGAGVIGNEYTSIFRTLGIHTTLINEREKLLSFLDDEIIHALYYNLQTMGVSIHHKEKYESVVLEKDQIILSTQSKKKIKGDILLWANGRTGNTQGLCLENINIQTDKRSLIKVNKNFQTEHKHIYAIGDVIGHPSLGSVSHYQGRMVGRYINEVKPTKEFSKLYTCWNIYFARNKCNRRYRRNFNFKKYTLCGRAFLVSYFSESTNNRTKNRNAQNYISQRHSGITRDTLLWGSSNRNYTHWTNNYGTER